MSEEVSLAPLTVEDLPLLAGWLAQPHVHRWWQEPSDLAAVTDRYLPSLDGRDPTRLWRIEVDGRAVGLLQSSAFADEPEWAAAIGAVTDVTGAVGIDYLIGEPEALGRGCGTRAIALACDLLLAEGWARIVVDVAQANEASWRALQRCGFSIVWSGELASPDPADAGPQHVLVREP